MASQKEYIEKMAEQLFKETMAKYFWKLEKDMVFQVHKNITPHTGLTNRGLLWDAL